MSAALVALLAQAPAAESESLFGKPYVKLLLAIGMIVVSYLVGRFLSRRLRMPDHDWKFGLVTFTLLAAGVITALGWPPRLGIDLSGGVILVYEVSPDSQVDSEKLDLLIRIIRRRIDPSGTKQITIRPYGQRQIEIIIPRASTDEVEQVKRKITSMGLLEFRILADARWGQQDLRIMRLARSSPAREVRDQDGTLLARWVPLADKPSLIEQFHAPTPEGQVANTKGFATREVKVPGREKPRVEILVKIDPYHVNIASEGGGRLIRVAKGIDERGRPEIDFTFDSQGAARFAQLTRENLPRGENLARHLAIILDGYLQSAPTIQSQIGANGRITGDFTNEEVDEYIAVLQAGQLPAELVQQPIREQSISATLGADMVQRGMWAMAISMVAVLLFMLVYYRFAGMVACVALLMNLLLILAVMIAIKGAFTLPGLAGLILTVGMAVDANVLIYERIREEMDKGSALRMAIRNGFARATTTIVDANLTTLITAIILYAIGTDQIRGFAVILFLGIIMSMYTAIFCSRLIFDVAERHFRLKKLTMMRLFTNPNIDFLGKRRLAIAGSLVLIAVGMGAVAARGRNLLDIDFTGGTSAEVVFRSSTDDQGNPIDIAYVRRKLQQWNEQVEQASAQELKSVLGQELYAKLEQMAREEEAASDQPLEERVRQLALLPDVTVSKLETLGEQSSGDQGGKPPRFVINTSNLHLRAVEAVLARVFQGQLATNRMEYERLPDQQSAATQGEQGQQGQTGAGSAVKQDTTEDKPEPKETPPAEGSDRQQENASQKPAPQREPAKKEEKPQEAKSRQEKPQDQTENKQSRRAEPNGALSLFAGRWGLWPGQLVGLLQQAPAESPAEQDKAASAPDQPKDKPASAPAGGKATSAPAQVVTKVKLTFSEPITKQHLEELLQAVVPQGVVFNLSNPLYEEGSTTPFDTWELAINVPWAQAQKYLEEVKTRLEQEPLFPSTNNIGSQVAAGMRGQALLAMFFSLVAIIIYIWIRFQHASFGLAAVVALIHDVLITLGLLALSAYLTFIPTIDPFKISLEILAAFLTIVGYSLNDTIVVFDRIREVRGKSPRLTVEMVNTAINQTLSRTLLTSLTTLIVVVILYLFGGQAIHGFSFALLVGVVVGTYSSIFIASPTLLWLVGSRSEKSSSAPARPAPEPTKVS